MNFEQLDELVDWSEARISNLGPAEARQLLAAADDMAKGLLRHPLVIEGATRHKQSSADGPTNTQPWHAVAEKLMFSLLCAQGKLKSFDSNHRLSHDIATRALPVVLAPAQTFLVRKQQMNLVRESPDLPRHRVSRELFPHAAMYVSYEVALEGELAGGRGFMQVDGVLVLAAAREIRLWSFGSLDGESTVLQNRIPKGTIYPDDFGAAADGAGNFLKLMSFMQQEVFVAEPHRLDRPRRRRMERAGLPRKQREEIIHVVELRPAAKGPEAGRGDGQRGERLHHWWVRGHWRAQWYPSEEAHRPVWIGPHVKGDRSKPLLEKVYDVRR